MVLIGIFYYSFYNKRFINARGKNEILLFYRFRDNTIYSYYKHIKTQILAHEMAHCIISNYFTIVPPIKSQEILAMYVDKSFR